MKTHKLSPFVISLIKIIIVNNLLDCLQDRSANLLLKISIDKCKVMSVSNSITFTGIYYLKFRIFNKCRTTNVYLWRHRIIGHGKYFVFQGNFIVSDHTIILKSNNIYVRNAYPSRKRIARLFTIYSQLYIELFIKNYHHSEP